MGAPILFESKSCGATRVYRARPWGPCFLLAPTSTVLWHTLFATKVSMLQRCPSPNHPSKRWRWHQETGIFPGYTVSLSHLGYSTRHDPIHVSTLHDMRLKMWDLASPLMIWCIKFTVAHQIHPWITCSWSNALPHHFSLICGQIDRKHSQRTQRLSCWKGGNNLKPFQERTGRCN